MSYCPSTNAIEKIKDDKAPTEMAGAFYTYYTIKFQCTKQILRKPLELL